MCGEINLRRLSTRKLVGLFHCCGVKVWEPLVGLAMSAADEVIERWIAAYFKFIFHTECEHDVIS